MNWKLKCLLCGREDTNLVKMQEHVMSGHHRTQDDLRNTTKRQTEEISYIYTFPDGVDWMEATRAGGNYLNGL
jgi:hypothetical protein